jgi:hypothetical protein
MRSEADSKQIKIGDYVRVKQKVRLLLIHLPAEA